MHISIGTTRTGNVIFSVSNQYRASVDIGRLIILNLHLALCCIYIKDIAIRLITDRSGYRGGLGSIHRYSNCCAVIGNLGRMPVTVRAMGDCHGKLRFRQKNSRLTDICTAVNLNLHLAIFGR